MTAGLDFPSAAGGYARLRPTPTQTGDKTLYIPDASGILVPMSSLTGSIYLPVGTTAQRDAVPVAGMSRLNTTTGKFEGYNGSAWQQMSAGLEWIQTQTANGSSSIDFTTFDGSKYVGLMCFLSAVRAGTTGGILCSRIGTGGAFHSSNYHYGDWRWTGSGQGVGGSSAAESVFGLHNGETLRTDVGGGVAYFSGTQMILGCNNSNPVKHALWHVNGIFESSTPVSIIGGGNVATNSANIDRIGYLMNIGAIAAGTFTLFGIRP